MTDIQTDTGKQWLSEFQGSENRMKERIIAIEAEIRQAVKDEISVLVADVVKMQGYVNTYTALTNPSAEQTADLQTDLQTLNVDLAKVTTTLSGE